MIQSPDKSITGEQPLEREPEMTTITARGSEDHDDFERVQQGIDWLERLEVIKARQDRESAIQETVEYVNRLRAAVTALARDADVNQIAAQYGSDDHQYEGRYRTADEPPVFTELQPCQNCRTQYKQTENRCRKAMTVLDHGRHTERGNDLSITEWPVGTTQS